VNFKWIQPGQPALILAPMEGVMDAPMRALLTERGGITYCVSEFLRISQEVPPLHVFTEHVPELSQGSQTPVGVPIQVQLLGGNAERLAQSAALACVMGAPAIDLNFGCPAPTVNRHDGGASLLRYPERIREIVAAVKAAVPESVPVSAKLRLGWESMDDVFENAEQAYLGGAAWITVHARTKMQGYRPPAHWKYIAEIRRRIPIEVIANGEIWTLDDFKRCRDETGCTHFMLGRGAWPTLP
jgi:tRNA-dihydrouridine synthase C